LTGRHILGLEPLNRVVVRVVHDIHGIEGRAKGRHSRMTEVSQRVRTGWVT